LLQRKFRLYLTRAGWQGDFSLANVARAMRVST
jgi:hypothetical protein